MDSTKPVAAHEQVRHLVEVTMIPQHEERHASEEFQRNRHHLVYEEGHMCWICGAPKELEVHHIHEWALWNELDPVVVMDTLRVFDPYGFTKAGGETALTGPDDIRNLLVLCHTHHTHPLSGVHATTFVTWLAQRAAKQGTVVVPATVEAVVPDTEAS